MNRLQLVKRVRSMTRDFSSSIFREEDIHDYINEGIDRLKQVMQEFEGMLYLEDGMDTPSLLPNQYHYLLSLYSTSRCFGQDERHYQATTYMNEFETKLDELKQSVEEGRIKIKDSNGNVVTRDNTLEYVTQEYFDAVGSDGDNVEIIIEQSDEPRDLLYWDDLDA